MNGEPEEGGDGGVETQRIVEGFVRPTGTTKQADGLKEGGLVGGKGAGEEIGIGLALLACLDGNCAKIERAPRFCFW